MKCPECGRENPANSKFCLECGGGFSFRCSQCGSELPAGAKFCNECGSRISPSPSTGEGRGEGDRKEPRDYTPQHFADPSIRFPLRPGSGLASAGLREAQDERVRPRSYTPQHLVEKILESRSVLEGERKTITALFADIKGSMELLEDLDPEDARSLIDPALELMMDAVHRYEGYVAQSTGDGIFALFGAPIAHEDHPRRACYAALRMQEEMRRYAEKLRLEKGIPLQVRVGLNTGEVVLRSIRTDDLHTDYVPVGHSTGLAARMQGLAAPGSIVVSEGTHRLTKGYFQFKALGPTKVKGVSEPVEIYEVTGVGPLRTRMEIAAQRGLVRFVGRHDEMEQMRRAWEAAKHEHGQIVSVMGEAGVGKSRLFYEFKVPLESQCLVLEAFSVSHGKAYAYLPVIELLKSYFRITLEDDERTRREKIGGKVLMLDRSLEDTLPYLFLLLGIAEAESSLKQMDAQIRRRRTMEAVKRVLVRETLNQPLLVIFEDLHWIDGETQAFLDVLADSVATAKILLLVNYRPAYQDGWASKTYYARLRLDPLGKEEAGELLAALLGDGAAAGMQPLRQLILEKTEGNPFFMEEVVQALAEEGVVAGERGSYRLDKPATELHIPTTVQGVLAARIDRLPPEEKALLQTLAVMGKEFTFGLVQRVTDQPEEGLYRLFAHLQAGEFIYEQPAFPEPEYTFKHALTQEVAYQSLLVERRKVLHERTARAIEDIYRYGLAEHYAELAHQYGRTDNTAKAVEYLQLAGQQALERSAYEEATRQLNWGVELLDKLPKGKERDQAELLLQTTLGPALIATIGWSSAEAEKAFARASDLCEQLGDDARLVRVLWGLAFLHVGRAELRKAREVGERVMALAESSQEPTLLIPADSVLGYVLQCVGEYEAAARHLDEAIQLYDPHEHRWLASVHVTDPGASCQLHKGLQLWLMGFPDQAREMSREGLRLAEELSHPFTLANVMFYTGVILWSRGEDEEAKEMADTLAAFSDEHGFAQQSLFASVLQGMALGRLGKPELVISQLRQAVEALAAMGQRLAMPLLLAVLAEAHGMVGESERGLQLVAEAMHLVNETGERRVESPIHRIKGDLLLISSAENEAEAERCFRQAIEVALGLKAKSNELQATISLARLWRQQGKKEEARQLLAEIYGWFTEGFDTRDLKDAKALLDELA